MFKRKKSFLLILFSLLPFILLLCGSCDDSGSKEEEEVYQIKVEETGTSSELSALRQKFSQYFDSKQPLTWTRSSSYYSKDNENGFSADAICNTYQQNWQGKWIYLAHDFKNEDGEKMYDDIIFFFDNKENCTDGYYIYLNTLTPQSDSDED